MGNNSTGRAPRPAPALPLSFVFAFVAACSPDQGPAPNLSAASIAAASALAGNAPQLAVCELLPSSPLPAPTAESLVRTTEPPRRHDAVALGRSAASWIDDSFTQTLAAEGTARHDFAASTDRDAIELVMVGRANFAVIGGQLSDRDLRAGLRETRVGVELYGLAVPVDSPVRSMSRSQLREVLTGQVTSWQQLGFDGGAIVCVVPADRNLAERAAKALIPGDAFASTSVRVADDLHVADQLLQQPNAIAVVRVTKGPREPGQKLLQIDWCPPTLEAFGYGTYPFGLPMTVVCAGPLNPAASDFVRFARSESGQELLGRSLLLLP